MLRAIYFSLKQEEIWLNLVFRKVALLHKEWEGVKSGSREVRTLPSSREDMTKIWSTAEDEKGRKSWCLDLGDVERGCNISGRLEPDEMRTNLFSQGY